MQPDGGSAANNAAAAMGGKAEWSGRCPGALEERAATGMLAVRGLETQQSHNMQRAAAFGKAMAQAGLASGL